MERQLNYYLAFNCIFKLRSGIIAGILDYFAGDAAAAWHHPEQWADIAILSGSAINEVMAQRRGVDPDKLAAACRAYGCKLTWSGRRGLSRGAGDDLRPALSAVLLGRAAG
jgi:hypothetical protein